MRPIVSLSRFYNFNIILKPNVMIHFKPLQTSDIDTVLALMKDFYAIDSYPFDNTIAKQLLVTFLSDNNLGSAWLIFENENLVGYVVLTFIFSFEYKGKIAFVDELYLVEKARGKGIGKTTIQFIQSQASQLLLKMIYLEVEKHNQNAQKLYLSQDFKHHDRMIMKYTINKTPNLN